MKLKQKTVIDVILLFLVFAATAFIFFNSSLDSASSTKVSDGVTNVIVPDSVEVDEELIKLIRKSAHILEFALLGSFAMLFVMHRAETCRPTAMGFSLFYVLAVAVTDEHIQKFSDRSSSTSDIILDFCGAMAGFAIAFVALKLVDAIKH